MTTAGREGERWGTGEREREIEGERDLNNLDSGAVVAQVSQHLN